MQIGKTGFAVYLLAICNKPESAGYLYSHVNPRQNCTILWVLHYRMIYLSCCVQTVVPDNNMLSYIMHKSWTL